MHLMTVSLFISELGIAHFFKFLKQMNADKCFSPTDAGLKRKAGVHARRRIPGIPATVFLKTDHMCLYLIPDQPNKPINKSTIYMHPDIALHFLVPVIKNVF